MPNIIGIDVGSRYTKVVELDKKLSVVEAFIFETPYTNQKNNLPEIDNGVFLKQLVNRIPLNRLKSARISMNLPEGSITLNTLIIPKMPKKELAAATVNEAKRVMIPATGPQHTFEFELTGERIVDKISKYEVVVIRADKADIQRAIKIFKDIDNPPVLITPSCYASVVAMPPDFWKGDASVAFLDIGSTYINISIAKKGKLFFVRNVSYGFQDIVNDMALQLNIPTAETVRMVEEIGVPQIDFDLQNKAGVEEEIIRQKSKYLNMFKVGDKHEINLLELGLRWQTHIERIIQELRRSLAFYKEQSRGARARVEYICFLGGGSQAKNLVKILSSWIGGECTLLLPFKGTQITQADKDSSYIFSSSIFVNTANLALDVLDKNKTKALLNFLPLEFKRKEIILARRFFLRLAGILLIILFSALTFFGSIKQQKIKHQISVLDFQIGKFKDVSDRMSYLNEQTTLLNNRNSQIAEILKKKNRFIPQLNALAKILPREILLAKISISDRSNTQTEMGPSGAPAGSGVPAETTPAAGQGSGQYSIKMEAQTLATYEKAIALLKDLKSRLESTGLFSNVTFTPLTLDKISAQDLKQTGEVTPSELREFTLTANLNTP